MIPNSRMFTFSPHLDTMSCFLLISKDQRVEDSIKQKFWSDISMVYEEKLSHCSIQHYIALLTKQYNHSCIQILTTALCECVTLKYLQY